MKNILCVEAGSFGGGSAESLFTHIKCLRNDYNFICIFTSENKFSKKIEELGIKVFYSKNNFFNIKYEKQNYLLYKVYALLYKFTYSKFIKLHEKIIYIFNKEYYKLIENIINKNDIDLIHTNNQPNRDFYIFNLANKHNIKIISHIRTFNMYGFSKIKANRCNNLVDRYITYSTFLKETWSNKDLLANEKISVVPNSVVTLNECELNEISSIPVQLKKYSKDIKIGIIGRIIPERGHLFALNVLKNLSNHSSSFKLFIIGDYQGFENYYELLQKTIEELGIRENVVFTGFVNKPYQYISNINILLMPYTIEPFGRTLLESWQLKTPIVLSKVGHIESIVKHEQDAMLFEEENIESCIDCILQIINNNTLKNELVSNGYKSYINNYTPMSYREKLLNIYNEVLI